MTRLRILRGGRLPDEELAALAVALIAIAAEEPTAQEASLPAWQQAALYEGTGAPAVMSATDLAVLVAGEEAAGLRG